MAEAVRAGDVVSAVRRVGADALLVEFSDSAWVTALDAEVRARWGGPSERTTAVHVGEVVPAARTLLLDRIGLEGVHSVLAVDDVQRLIHELSSWTLSLPQDRAAAMVEVPVAFDGPDLDAVATLWDMTVPEVVATVVEAEFQVAFCGFSPGFAYLSGLPEGRAVPRRTTPRTRVPANAFGLAGEYAGLYPRSSPGGWQLLGTAVGVVLWDDSREPPALLTPGTRVRVVEDEGVSP
ncbi:5-oxoprolinase subunit B family protein [Demequina aestuarii]|uniref:5-oxoprolinase subunit B family protein n=1 Tax=Demequina aestuarii TaxID=327095 RepID=UPI000783309E|nr:allophanate hydrolase subunit 1 [Demequina aestuarii]